MNFTEGYKTAVRNMETKLNESIKRNGGARTTDQCVRVLNDLITYLHIELSNAPEEENTEYEMSVEGDVQRFFDEIFGDMTTLQIVKGGR